MLCLSFRQNQRAEITTASGETIVVHVNRIAPNGVRLAFECDKSTKILRGTVVDADSKGKSRNER